MSDISNNRQLLCNSKEQKLLSKNLEYYNNLNYYKNLANYYMGMFFNLKVELLEMQQGCQRKDPCHQFVAKSCQLGILGIAQKNLIRKNVKSHITLFFPQQDIFQVKKGPDNTGEYMHQLKAYVIVKCDFDSFLSLLRITLN